MCVDPPVYRAERGGAQRSIKVYPYAKIASTVLLSIVKVRPFYMSFYSDHLV